MENPWGVPQSRTDNVAYLVVVLVDAVHPEVQDRSDAGQSEGRFRHVGGDDHLSTVKKSAGKKGENTEPRDQGGVCNWLVYACVGILC